MRVIKFVPFVLAIFLMLPVECYAENEVIFSEKFIRGTPHNLKRWNEFKAKLTKSFFYEGINLKGDFDKKGISCSDSIVVNKIANALHSGKDGIWACEGNQWSYCNRYGGELWINPPELCYLFKCPKGYILRPGNKQDWGGVNTKTCGAPSQEMSLVFSVKQNEEVEPTQREEKKERRDLVDQKQDSSTEIQIWMPKIIGKYHALLIGVQNYRNKNVGSLTNPLQDIIKVKKVLTGRYTFKEKNIITLKNPTRSQLIDQLELLQKSLTSKDNLLIFYAGHGYWREQSEQGYWWPSDADRQNAGNWISNSTIRDYIKGIQSQHTLLISDACFSGGIFVSRGATTEEVRQIEELYTRKSRRAITSGAKNELVPDESIFLKYFIEHLEKNEKQILDSQSLFAEIRIPIIRNSSTVPLDGHIQNAGDEGGDFLFIRRQNHYLLK